ncbi:hypothetical protein Mgra_00001846 [Meloidogyne graminicola]|uniref:Ion transport domain-containing protein n=1 Tax=Meloidogyne graminicola TaxID=189291 RepID=A0A8T0A0F3_9BILA|nr:hypothetical protein Mgra_00001846 [Meloidogyne graminicola]
MVLEPIATDLEQTQSLTTSNLEHRHVKHRKQEAKELLELFNERSLFWEDEDGERTVYIFDYSKTSDSEKKGGNRREFIDRHLLQKLRDYDQWRLDRHPLVLNFVNEKLISCAFFYLFHVIVYFVFLGLLFSYAEGPPSIAKNLLVTTIIFFFIFILVVKASLKLQTKGCTKLSLWFYFSYTWTVITSLIALFYIWSWYIFNFDNFNQEEKKTIEWLLPIVAIIASWINCLYVLRKAPCGPYILMMSKILYSFLGTCAVWIPTLFTFAFAFLLIMRDSGARPWDDSEGKNNNITSTSFMLALFQSFTKTSAMMIGEVEANDILGMKEWIANLLLILFEIITVILLMNLMISLAVGDVNELNLSAEEMDLKIKVNFCIESLHLSEQISFAHRLINVLHRSTTNNVLIVDKNGQKIFSTYFANIRESYFNVHLLAKSEQKSEEDELINNQNNNGIISVNQQKCYELEINTKGLKLRKEQLCSRKATLLNIEGITIKLSESPSSGIQQLISSRENIYQLASIRDHENLIRKFQRWFIGLNLRALL